MNDVTDTLQQALMAAQVAANSINALTHALIALGRDPRWLAGDVAGAQPERLRFAWPVGSDAAARSARWPDPWFVAMGYAMPYPPALQRNDYHTGIDLNLAGYADSGKPVHACADGVVAHAGEIDGWGLVVIVEHALEDGRTLWSRYAHLSNVQVAVDARVARGDVLATIGDYAPLGKLAGDHLHFDVASANLRERPGDWPGADLDRLRRDYCDPVELVRGRLA